MSPETKDPLITPDSEQYSNAWQTLDEARNNCESLDMRQLFAADPGRSETFTRSAAGLTLDFSKNLIDGAVFDALLGLAEAACLPAAIQQLLDGDTVNHTEQRPAVHTALRGARAATAEERELVEETLGRMAQVVADVAEGHRTGYTGKAFTDVVNIGIGGSDLGPAMVTEVLTPYHSTGLNLHFVSNVDPSHLYSTLRGLNPETTLFIVASKTFTTLETLSNATQARQWLTDSAPAGAALNSHFLAVSANVERAQEFGIDADAIYPMWDWVGGRYSLWSAIGLPIAMAVGMDNFRALGEGAAAMDRHFGEAAPADNLPIILALLEIWYVNFWGAQSQAVLPYDQYLAQLPAFLQQLTMESNGKSVTRDGSPVSRATCPIVWGAAGTNGQHSFHQLLHQGTHLIPVDFIVPLQSQNPLGDQHAHLFTNCLAQARTLLEGKTLETAQRELMEAGLDMASAAALAPHKVLPGNRPSNAICFDKTSPQALGALIALYEHKVFASSVLWNINAFDQWGVEMGKQTGQSIYAQLIAEQRSDTFDSSTEQLLALFRKANNR